MSIGRERKDPEAEKTFGFNWANELASGDTIESSAWEVETPDGDPPPSLAEETNDFTDTTTSIRVSGGQERATYMLKNTVVTVNGDTLVKRLMLDVEKE